MSPQYPGQPPRRLERSRDDRVIAGVCGGIAEYLNMDATLVRILTVVLTLVTGAPLFIYLVAMLVMPEQGRSPRPPAGVDGPPPPWQHVAPGTWPRQPGADDAVWGPAGPPWDQPQPAPTWPQPPSPGPRPNPSTSGHTDPEPPTVP